MTHLPHSTAPSTSIRTQPARLPVLRTCGCSASCGCGCQSGGPCQCGGYH